MRQNNLSTESINETKALAASITLPPVHKSTSHLLAKSHKPAHGKATPASVALTELEYRDIAKMLVKALPVDGDEFTDTINEYLAVIKALPAQAKVALKAAYIFGSKAPHEEREDLFQDLALAVLKAQTGDIKLAYAIARCDWLDWWRKFKVHEHYSLDSVIEDTDGNATTLGELLVGESEFEAKMDGKLDGERMYDKLPANIKPIVNKRLIGKALNASERGHLHRYVKEEGYKLLLA